MADLNREIRKLVGEFNTDIQEAFAKVYFELDKLNNKVDLFYAIGENEKANGNAAALTMIAELLSNAQTLNKSIVDNALKIYVDTKTVANVPSMSDETIELGSKMVMDWEATKEGIDRLKDAMIFPIVLKVLNMTITVFEENQSLWPNGFDEAVNIKNPIDLENYKQGFMALVESSILGKIIDSIYRLDTDSFMNNYALQELRKICRKRLG